MHANSAAIAVVIYSSTVLCGCGPAAQPTSPGEEHLAVYHCMFSGTAERITIPFFIEWPGTPAALFRDALTGLKIESVVADGVALPQVPVAAYIQADCDMVELEPVGHIYLVDPAVVDGPRRVWVLMGSARGRAFYRYDIPATAKVISIRYRVWLNENDLSHLLVVVLQRLGGGE